ncbi:glutamate-5-semialdehyde dehydrogenase [Desulfohalobiaceae bacterium Ax17]|jgi:glutamate-5-semialdehyde dehydrogenase|uniref:glutamate-5-semialdehyde dehydrogenase n=1 Tax=Desulfovulcanus ferrireducens TaxID=2831190 RepID=UPI00207BB100|nr:glutamate-5-semialdehyde dehydrogenase [Desulfovulcanus ferrireducens]MBT8763936.1 glutamate-5-semialdehyde dehydrogenase [Desulfovulcanus ferrireducens]
MSLKEKILELAKQAKQASRKLATASGAHKNAALYALSELLKEKEQEIIQANELDLSAAKERGLDQARIDRLKLTPKIIAGMAQACVEVAAMSDPVGEIEEMKKRPNGLMVGRMRIPLGVVAIIYESRPNVTIDAAILCLKAGNAVILRGGSEAFHSNQVLSRLISQALKQAGLPEEGVVLLPTTDREAVKIMLKLDEFIDVVIPRGGEGLIRAVVEQATMPVLKHYKGVCHIYVHKDADVNAALDIVFNAKVQRPGVCNALECLLVHKEIAEEFLPLVAQKLGSAGVKFHACPVAMSHFSENVVPATEDDWGQEYLSLDLAVKVVNSQDEAQEHIARYGSNHSEAILTRDYQRALKFIQEVDASAVLVNASTRFNDGGQFGLGAEIGISTSKLHAYGPMGIKELTSTKFVVFGQGQVRE